MDVLGVLGGDQGVGGQVRDEGGRLRALGGEEWIELFSADWLLRISAWTSTFEWRNWAVNEASPWEKVARSPSVASSVCKSV